MIYISRHISNISYTKQIYETKKVALPNPIDCPIGYYCLSFEDSGK